MSRNHKTPKGTELPILNLRGKDYLEVKYRLVWFREEHPDWSIVTEFVSLTDKSACAKATIRDGQGKVISTSHKFENERGFPDFMEKAETGSIGRALALIGYGTQFCADDLDEGQRIVDSPVEPQRSRSAPQSTSQQSEQQSEDGLAPGLTQASEGQLGEFQIQFGKKYRGKKLKDLPESEVLSYLDWLEAEARKKRVPVSHEVKVLKHAAERYYGQSGNAGYAMSEDVQDQALNA